MEKQLLDIQPGELKFIFELKKQSTCNIRLVNNTHQHVAFKVKTTSPKKYCVRPNAGIIAPKSAGTFNVTMQAPRSVPTDMICKDKFLIQGTVVPPGTTEEDITSGMFSKDEGRYVEENKLRVSLISPPHSPDLSPLIGTFKQGLNEAPVKNEQEWSGVDFFCREPMVANAVEYIKIVNNGDLHVEKDVKSEEKRNLAEEIVMKAARDVKSEEKRNLAEVIVMEAAKDVKSEEKKNLEEEIVIKTAKDAKLEEEKNLAEETVIKAARDVKSEERENSAEEVVMKAVKDAKSDDKKTLAEEIVMEEAKDVELQQFVKTNVEEVSLSRDVEEIKSKLDELESKLSEAQDTISKLTEDRRLNTQDRAFWREELAILRSRKSRQRVQAEFPLLFVVMVVMISATLGYLLHS
ncbi:vesicle-associated protein 2-2-like [Syzygium oleosum]|uniref:vesicle-associated protein 2-2-like n=1 Tax=Syzygium oleosum TaxID=219896 RepID=UPI0011D1A36F|nr:vesicle-associated protein 2-2-like [Syzygium oleosum]XP_030467031.1 vesicle-associated protein 2-2-like [Syzygium oleosum]